MALRLRDGYEELLNYLKELEASKFHYLGEYVFADGEMGDGKLDAEYWCLNALPYVCHINRIVMIFQNELECRMIHVYGKWVAEIRADRGARLIESLQVWKYPKMAVGPVTECVRLIYPGPVFLPLLLNYGLIQRGVSLRGQNGSESEDQKLWEEIQNIASIKDIVRDYFEQDERDNVSIDTDFLCYFLDHSVIRRKPMEQIEELSNCYAGLYLMQQENARTPENIALEEKMSLIEKKLRAVAMSHGMEAPFDTPKIYIALWQIDQEFPAGLPLSELVRIAEALRRKWSYQNLFMPDPLEESRSTNLWRYYRNTLERQITQVETRIEEQFAENQITWEDYLL